MCKVQTNNLFLAQVILTEIFEIERYFVVGFSARNLAEKGIFETVQNLRFGLMEPAISALLSHCRLHIQQTIAPSNLLREQDHERIKQLSATFFKFFRCLGFMGYSIFLLGISYSLLMYGGSKLTDHPGPLLTKMECFIVFLVVIRKFQISKIYN